VVEYSIKAETHGIGLVTKTTHLLLSVYSNLLHPSSPPKLQISSLCREIILNYLNLFMTMLADWLIGAFIIDGNF
jgi:hypothetical protein